MIDNKEQLKAILATAETLVSQLRAVLAPDPVIVSPVIVPPVIAPPVADVLTDLTEAGYNKASQLKVYRLIYKGGVYLVELPSLDPKQIVFRGANLPDNSFVQWKPGLKPGVFNGGNSGRDGMDQPTNLPDFPGYVLKRYDGDGREYYEFTGKAPVSTVVQAPSIETPEADPDKEFAITNAENLS